MRKWNIDKKHRCPECHTIWVYGPRYIDKYIKPRWWRIYQCYSCGIKFAGWGRGQ